MRPQQAPVSGKVFIQRDYSSGTRCQFQTKFPAELENRIDRQQFEETVRTLNNLYAEAEKLGGQSYLEGCLACLTAYTIFLCMETHYEKVICFRIALIKAGDLAISTSSFVSCLAFVYICFDFYKLNTKLIRFSEVPT
ncbi:golgin subfamily A member 7 isoform X2 [Tursiops truncatus]|uniref:golgin subfamily A member 7 isoform X2 n=1 Tax=Tursiops truncatus TaxID=9739 RepID=UPI003CCEFD5F